MKELILVFECGKRFDKLTPWNANGAKKKHLVFNHSHHAKEILNLVTVHLNKIGENKYIVDGNPIISKDLIMKEKKGTNYLSSAQNVIEDGHPHPT